MLLLDSFECYLAKMEQIHSQAQRDSTVETSEQTARCHLTTLDVLPLRDVIVQPLSTVILLKLKESIGL